MAQLQFPDDPVAQGGLTSVVPRKGRLPFPIQNPVAKATGGDIRTFPGASVSDPASAIAFYLERFHQGYCEEAFHGLLELDHAALPDLAEAFRASTDTSMRAFLLNVIWQHRQPSEIPLLAEALFTGEPEIWQTAMDGLVAFASPESVQALRRAKTRRFTNDCEGKRFNEWLEEAIEQAESQMNS